jgi:LPXTG-motif cell wall-anchored protein
MTSGGTAVQFGGWLEETNGTARAGQAYVVKSGATIVGMYVSEDNGVNEGYPATVMAAAAPAAAGYSKVAVPACTDCNYTIESWSLAAPGTTDGLINTMGSGTCPNTVTAGSTTSLDTCTTPTVVSLRSLKAAGGSAPLAALPAAGLALLGGLAVLLRRRRA